MGQEVPELTKAETGPEAVLGRKDSHNAAEKTRAAWRQEMEKTAPAAEGESDGEVHGVEDEEDVDRKVQESRARREALMAKWVNRGERNGKPGTLLENHLVGVKGTEVQAPASPVSAPAVVEALAPAQASSPAPEVKAPEPAPAPVQDTPAAEAAASVAASAPVLPKPVMEAGEPQIRVAPVAQDGWSCACCF
ncbi:unnamed protein product [Effrenium voratum]|nr:unnamed protein product [Effrenium voratum]